MKDKISHDVAKILYIRKFSRGFYFAIEIMPKSRIFNVANISLNTFCEKKNSQEKFPNLQ